MAGFSTNLFIGALMISNAKYGIVFANTEYCNLGTPGPDALESEMYKVPCDGKGKYEPVWRNPDTSVKYECKPIESSNKGKSIVNGLAGTLLAGSVIT